MHGPLKFKFINSVSDKREMGRHFPISNFMKLNSAIMESLYAYRIMGRTDGRSDFNRLPAGIRARLGKEKITVLMGQ